MLRSMHLTRMCGITEDLHRLGPQRLTLGIRADVKPVGGLGIGTAEQASICAADIGTNTRKEV